MSVEGAMKKTRTGASLKSRYDWKEEEEEEEEKKKKKEKEKIGG